MKATKIKMHTGKQNSNSLLEIDDIYITGCDKPGFYEKAKVHDYLLAHPKSIQVDIDPYPSLVPKTSVNNEKYCASSPNSTTKDNLLSLPRV